MLVGPFEVKGGRALQGVTHRCVLDERDDLVVGFLSRELGVMRSTVDVLYAGEDLEWRRRPLFAREGKAGIWATATGDLDGDGKTDIAFATGHGEVLVFLADEAGFRRTDVWTEKIDEDGEPITGLRRVKRHAHDASWTPYLVCWR